MKICLIIVFNHKYNKNIEKLESIYSKRFSNIYYLMPFYKGNKKNVIPVYESSYQFQGYFSQGFNEYFQEKYDYYVFIGDDLILNPSLNESNIISKLNLDNSSYIKSIKPMNQSIGIDSRKLYDTLCAFNTKKTGVEYENEIPSYKKAMQKAKKYGIKDNRLKYKFFKNMPKKNFLNPNVLKKFFEFIIKTNGKLPYPLFKDYSDLLILKKEDIYNFIKLSGVFAAMGLFAEIAIPTSMVLSCSKISTEKNINFYGVEFWSNLDKMNFEDEYNLDLNELFNNWEKDILYFHPVKLSKWECNLKRE